MVRLTESILTFILFRVSFLIIDHHFIFDFFRAVIHVLIFTSIFECFRVPTFCS